MHICGNGYYSLESKRKENVSATLKDSHEANDKVTHWIKCLKLIMKVGWRYDL